jgi:hypothetical protein
MEKRLRQTSSPVATFVTVHASALRNRPRTTERNTPRRRRVSVALSVARAVCRLGFGN